jgi:lipopolysaccharide heptosyltransferase I
MSDILFVKTSSLGDVIHHMPAITDARRHLPQARFAWVVEEKFAPLVRLHPAVAQTIPAATRRWRSELSQASTWSEIRTFVRDLRRTAFAEIIDSQGLLRSALMTRSARGRRHGYDRRSIREPLASLFYDVRHRVDRKLHAVERNRRLTGLALGYSAAAAPDYGLDRQRLAITAASPYGVLLHATARPEKHWPEESWVALGTALARRQVELVLPWGSETERSRSERLAAMLLGSRVPPLQPLDAMARLIAGASFVIGVDTGLLHLAAALGVPLVAIFVGTDPGLTGPRGSGPIGIAGRKGSVPSTEEVFAKLEQVLAQANIGSLVG